MQMRSLSDPSVRVFVQWMVLTEDARSNVRNQA